MEKPNNMANSSNTINEKDLCALTKLSKAQIAKAQCRGLIPAGATMPTNVAIIGAFKFWSEEFEKLAGTQGEKAKLTWREKFDKARTEQVKLQNTEVKRIASDYWMPAAEHHEILSALIQRIELIPEKVKSEFGLTDPQFKGLIRELDSARQDAAKELGSK